MTQASPDGGRGRSLDERKTWTMVSRRKLHRTGCQCVWRTNSATFPEPPSRNCRFCYGTGVVFVQGPNEVAAKEIPHHD